MVKYRNPRKELETQEVEEMEREEEVLAEPATSVEEEKWKKRYGDLRRHTDASVNEQKARVVELERKLDQALRGQLKAPKSDEDVEAWVSQYPEFAGILETIVQKRISEATSKTTEKLSAIESQQKELEAEKAYIALKKVHSDLDELTNSDEFHKWLSDQKQKYQDAIYRSLDVDEADFVISKYKLEKNKTKGSKVDDDGFNSRSAAKVVRTPAVREEPNNAQDYEFTESGIEAESRRNRNWYAQNEAKIMDAHRKGKILYDLSGGAR